jgi:hypothetical protein
MRQKYVISREGPSNMLTITEYAIIETKVKKPIPSTAQKGKFTFFCKETYEDKVIVKSISNGIKALVAILRTRNFYPIEPYAIKIAETVMALYNSSENGPVELLFDDVDLVSLDMKTTQSSAGKIGQSLR